MTRKNLLGLSRQRLAEVLAPFISRSYRVEQVFRAIHLRGVRDLGDITELSRELRGKLAEHFFVAWPEFSEILTSRDGTEKALFELEDGSTIEAVDIPDRERRTLCISSQAGCALACKFCVTGYWGAGRNLTSGEIVGQVLALEERRDSLVEGRSNLVFMGMGEPLLNLEAVGEALEILCESVSWRRVTVSTAGVVPGILEMSRWPRRPNLAVSLHAPDDERRERLMPINRSFGLAELMDALRGYPLEAGRRLTIEYLLVDRLNDAPGDALALAELLRGLPVKVNLIPMNPDPLLEDELRPPTAERIDAFRRRLRRSGLAATVRRRRGDDASAACGQLRAPGRTPRGFPGASS